MNFKIFWTTFYASCDRILDLVPIREFIREITGQPIQDNELIDICCNLSENRYINDLVQIIKDPSYRIEVKGKLNLYQKFIGMYACNRLLRVIYKNLKTAPKVCNNLSMMTGWSLLHPKTESDKEHLWMFLFTNFTEENEVYKKLHSYLLEEYNSELQKKPRKEKRKEKRKEPEKVIEKSTEFNEEFFEKNLLFLNQIVGIRNDVINPPKRPYIRRKKTIPKALKTSVWIRYAGSLDVGVMKCLCCKMRDIYQSDFHCGHIVAEANRGPTVLENLRPVCSICNLSMGTMNMDQFIKVNGF